jgi:ubiquinone/menaquinone biosynthesis C-methylase UbiE
MPDNKPLAESEFDRFAEQYHAQHAANIAVSGESPDFFAEYKVVDIAQIVAERHPDAGPAGSNLNILDFGAGIGNSVPFFRKYLPGASITCLDVSRRSLELGQARFGQLARFVHFDGDALPFPDQSFDIILCACVLHHIDHAQHAAVLARLRRLLTGRGLLFIFEHNPFNPLTVRAVNTCPFDANARLASARSLTVTLSSAGFSAVTTRYRIFFPGMLRKLRWLEKFLRWCPLGAQYVLIAQR